jgi:transposase
VHRFETARFPKAETQRQLLREQVGEDVGQFVACLDEAATPPSVREVPQVALLRQVFAQHYEGEGDHVRWRDGPAVSNQQRIVSPYDQQARSSRKRDLVWLGYKVHLSETCDQDPACPHLIIALETTPATLADTDLLAPIAEHLRAKDLAPAEHYVDQGYRSGAELLRQAQLGTQIIAPVGPDPSWQQREHTGYAIADFVLEWHEHVATCPQGQHSRVWLTQYDQRTQQPTVTVRFAATTCAACPVRAQCTHGQGGRTLPLRDNPKRICIMWPLPLLST